MKNGCVVKLMFKHCTAIMCREIHYMWRDKGLRYIILLGTFLGLALFYGIYSAQVIKDIPTAIVDLDNTSASRDVVEKLQTAENLKVITYPESYQALKELIDSGEAAVGIIIPENFGEDVALSRQTKVYTVIDGSNIVYATNASNAVMSVTGTVSAEIGIKNLIANGVQYQQAQEAYLGVSFEEQPWFNPTLNYAHFLVLALALNIWQQCCMLVSCMNIIGETGMKSWYQWKSIGFPRYKLFISKSAVHIAAFMLMVLPIYLLLFWLLKMPLSMGWGALLLLTLLFAVAVHSIGTLASSFARNAVDATRFGMIIALPSFVVSGYTWPLESMPGFIQILAKCIPQTWFFQGFNYIVFKDPGWQFMSQYFFALAAAALVCYSAASLITLRRS